MKTTVEKDTNLAPTGRDEMNLAEIPFTILSNRAEKDVKTLQGPRWIITGSHKFGLPLALDEEVYIAMMKLTRDFDFRRREVPFSRYQMIDLMRWDNVGRSYHRIRESFDRLAGVYVRTDQFWDNQLKQPVSRGFHILESYLLAEGKRGRKKAEEQPELPLSTFTWGEVLFASFQAGYIKLLDTERYFRLTLPTSRRAYRFLDKRLYQREEIELNLFDYAHSRIGLSHSYRYPSKIREKLNPSFEELIADGFLESVRYIDTDAGPAIVIRRAQLKRGGPDSPGDTDEQPEHNPLTTALTERGVSLDVAEDLVANHPAEQIHLRMEAFDWMIEQKHPHLKDNPPGYLRKSIERNWELPNGFVPQAQQQAEAESEAQNRQTQEAERASLEDARKQRAERSPWRELWAGVCREVAKQLHPGSFERLITPCYILQIREDDAVVIECPSQLEADLLQEHYQSVLSAAVEAVRGMTCTIEFAVDTART